MAGFVGKKKSEAKPVARAFVQIENRTGPIIWWSVELFVVATQECLSRIGQNTEIGRHVFVYLSDIGYLLGFFYISLRILAQVPFT